VFEIPDAVRATLPYSSICYVQCVWPDGFVTRASAVVVGPNDVLTADHAVYDADHGGYAFDITISPGADTYPAFNAPLGTYNDVGVIFSRAANWDVDGDGLLTSAESQSDLALLGLRTPIANVSGFTPVAPYAGDVTGTIDGYPARGTGLMEEAVTAQASPYWSVYNVDASLGPGASGSPLLQTMNGATYVVGVLSAGDSALTYSTYAGLFGSNWQWVQDAMRADDAVMTGVQVPASSVFPGAATGVVTYLGTSAGDIFHSTSLDETYVGRGGADSVVFSGSRADYQLHHSASNVLVDDFVTGRDGNDTLTDMAHAVFSDMNVNLRVGSDSQSISPWDLKLLEELYVGFFNRIPEADGLDYWIGQVRAGRSIVQVADNFFAAALQYPAQTGYSSSMTPADFVNLVYRNTLGRADGADAQGLQFWVDALAHGTSRGYLVDEIVQSALSFKSDATWGWVADLLDNKAAVANRFAVQMGLSYNSPQDSIAHGMQMASAVTPTSTAEAIVLIGVPDTFSTLG
jgi:V8-like Glu-specific endopeptidase